MPSTSHILSSLTVVHQFAGFPSCGVLNLNIPGYATSLTKIQDIID